MGFMSRRHFQIYSEPCPDSECWGEEEKYSEVLSSEVQSEARRAEVKEQELLAKQKCVRAAEILKGKKIERPAKSA